MDVDRSDPEPEGHEPPLSAASPLADPLSPSAPLAAMPEPSTGPPLGGYLRVVPSPRPRPISVMRTSPVPFGDSIPIAHSLPTLVPRISDIPREDSDSDTRDIHQDQSGDEATAGLYDDPDTGDVLHNDPLLHTARQSNDDSESDGNALRQAPANSRCLQVQVQVPTRLEYKAPLNANQLYRDSHPEWFARLLLLLVAVLHAKHRVSFRACALILFTLNTILLTLGVLQPTNPLPVTLHTVISRFDLQDRFTIYPICGSCHRIFPTDAPIDSLCSDCDSRLFKPISDRLFRRLTGHQPQRPPPICAAPIQLPSSLLADFLARGDNEDSCSSWKSRPRVPGELKDISDGEVWKTICGADKKPFFSDLEDDSSELRIGVTMSLDWCAYFFLPY